MTQNPDNTPQQKKRRVGLFPRVVKWALGLWEYCSTGVWADKRNTPWVKFVKTMNLTVNSFFDRDLQIKSMALTYSTVLAIVPAIALLVAIGRGFGLQDSIQNELYIIFPSQHKVITTFLTFVDSYLTNATQGLFVGIGILVLLWTVISLLSSIESAFNSIWDVKSDRTFFQKLTDYIAICMIIPILLICSSGVSIFMSTTLQDSLYFPFLTPVVNFILELAPLFLYWIAFSLSYFLIPNTKINFKFAAIAGVIAAFGFYILQWLFLNGQIYVSKYNAIYGSFAFLPLLLIWLQFSWLLLLTGCVLTYALQNVLMFNFLGNDENICIKSMRDLAIIIMAIIARRFDSQQSPLSQTEIAARYGLPVRMVGKILTRLKNAGMIYFVDGKDHNVMVAPARETASMTVADVMRAIDNSGSSFITPFYNTIFADTLASLRALESDAFKTYSDTLLSTLPLPEPAPSPDSSPGAFTAP